MFKIDKDYRASKLPPHMKEHLTFYDPFQTKSILATFTFIIIDMMIILPLLIPYETMTTWLTVPLIIGINLWCIWLLFQNAYRIQMSSILFMAALCSVGAFCYFVLVQKYGYVMLGFEGPAFFIGMIVGYILMIVGMVRYYRKMFSSTKRRKKNEKRPSKLSWSILGASPGIGLIAYHFVSSTSEGLVLGFMTFVYYFLGLFLTYFSVKMIHKYRFMKANQDFVTFAKPMKNSKHRNIEVR